MSEFRLQLIREFLDSKPFTVDKLRIICERLNLPKSGKKSDVIDRILSRPESEILPQIDKQDLISYLLKINVYNDASKYSPFEQLRKYWMAKEREYKKQEQLDAKVKVKKEEKITIKRKMEEQKLEELKVKELKVERKVLELEIERKQKLLTSKKKEIKSEPNIKKEEKNEEPNNQNIINNNNNNNNVNSVSSLSCNNIMTSSSNSSSSNSNLYSISNPVMMKTQEYQIAEDFAKLFYALVNGPNPSVTIVQQGLFFKDGTLQLYLHVNDPAKYSGIEKIALVFQDFRTANGQFNLCNIEAAVNEYGYISLIAYGNVTLPAKGVGPFQQKFVLCNYQGRWYVQYSELRIFDATNALTGNASNSSSSNSMSHKLTNPERFQITEL